MDGAYDQSPERTQETAAMRTEHPAGRKPSRSLVLAHADGPFAADCSRQFRRLGWEVHLAGSGPEARRLAEQVRPAVVVLGIDLPVETGWLTCDKLVRQRPAQRVVLVTDGDREEDRPFASFVRASGLVRREDGVWTLVEVVCGHSQPAKAGC